VFVSGLHKPMPSAVTAAALIAVILSIVACGSSSSPSPTTSTASAVGITDCFNRTVVQPKSLILACADAGVGASGLVWQDWGKATSTGRGIINIRVCVPNCAASTKVRHAPGTITVSRILVCPDGRRRYTRLTYNYSWNTLGPVTLTQLCPPYQP
jgi:hypothetical protein